MRPQVNTHLTWRPRVSTRDATLDAVCVKSAVQQSFRIAGFLYGSAQDAVLLQFSQAQDWTHGREVGLSDDKIACKWPVQRLSCGDQEIHVAIDPDNAAWFAGEGKGLSGGGGRGWAGGRLRRGEGEAVCVG